jgi:hypothetical protein
MDDILDALKEWHAQLVADAPPPCVRLSVTPKSPATITHGGVRGPRATAAVAFSHPGASTEPGSRPNASDIEKTNSTYLGGS